MSLWCAWPTCGCPGLSAHPCPHSTGHVARAASYPVAPLSPETVALLDPGIRDVVVMLRAHGFDTTDSGDGASKADAILSGDALPFPHVHVALSMKGVVDGFSGLGPAVMRLRELLPGWVVEVAYSSTDEFLVLTAYRMDVAESARG